MCPEQFLINLTKFGIYFGPAGPLLVPELVRPERFPPPPGPNFRDRALELIGKLVTGPWMHQLYTNQAIKNLESITYIKTCLQNLNESPLLALQAKTDTFGVPLYPDSDAVLTELQTADIEELEKNELHCILFLLIGGITYVIDKQLYEYFEGNLAHLTPSIAGQTLSAPVHNMFAKHTLGLADYLFRRATSMKVGFIDSKDH